MFGTVVVMEMLGSTIVTAEIAGATPPGGNGVIAFESTRSGNSDIWTIDPTGGDPVQLTTHPGSDYQPRYSPDGSLIAFSSDRDGDFDAFVMNADGSDVRQLTDDPRTSLRRGAQMDRPSCSPRTDITASSSCTRSTSTR
jgi:Tol biopolymer transport system component